MKTQIETLTDCNNCKTYEKLLYESMDIVNNLIDMMEPYYIQSNTSNIADNYLNEILSIKAVQVIIEKNKVPEYIEPHVPYTETRETTCSICFKNFRTHKAHNHHKRDKHFRKVQNGR